MTHTHTHMCQRKFSWKTSKLRTLKKMGENAKEKARKGRATESKSHGSWGVTFRGRDSTWWSCRVTFGGRCRDSSSPANSPHHRIISHNHIASQPHHISSHLIKQQPITSHIATTSHHIPSHWHNMTITSHHIISFDLTLRPTTWHHTASYHNASHHYEKTQPTNHQNTTRRNGSRLLRIKKLGLVGGPARILSAISLPLGFFFLKRLSPCYLYISIEIFIYTI